MNNEKYKWMVCIRCYTYNQSTYIKDAMEGFVMQETKFPYVCVIVDDYSNDGEQNIIKDFFEENFDIENKSIAIDEETEDYVLCFSRHKINKNCYFAVLYLKYNHYKRKAKDPYLKRWRELAKYEAICEGDDYWTDKEKLQIQVDEMDKHDKIDICAHTSIKIKNKLIHGYIRPIKTNGVIPVERVIRDGGGLVATNSLVIRTSINEKVYDYQRIMGGDYSMQIRGALRGGLLYIDREMSVYRVMTANSWSSRMKSDKNLTADYYNKQIKMLDVLNEETQNRYKDSIEKRITTISFQRACYIKDWQELKQKKYDFIFRHMSVRQRTQLFLSHYIPWLSQPVSKIVDVIYSIRRLCKLFCH